MDAEEVGKYERLQHRILMESIGCLKKAESFADLYKAGLRIKKALARFEIIGPLHCFRKALSSLNTSPGERAKSIDALLESNNITEQEIHEFVLQKKYLSDIEIMKLAVKTQNLMRLRLQSLNGKGKLDEPWTEESAFHSTNSLLGSSIFLTTGAVKRSQEGLKTSEDIVQKFVETTKIDVPRKWFAKVLPVEVRKEG